MVIITGFFAPFVVLSAHLYAALCEDVAKLMKRAITLYQKYSTKLYAEESYDRENLEEVSLLAGN